MSYFELGSKIFKLSQKARQIYEKNKEPEKRRSLVNFVFSNLYLKDKVLVPVYKNAFQIIAEKAKNKDWLRELDSTSDQSLTRSLLSLIAWTISFPWRNAL